MKIGLSKVGSSRTIDGVRYTAVSVDRQPHASTLTWDGGPRGGTVVEVLAEDYHEFVSRCKYFKTFEKAARWKMEQQAAAYREAKTLVEAYEAA